MNRIKSTKRLNLRRETLLSLSQLSHVVGGGGTTIIAQTLTCGLCPPTQNDATCNCVTVTCPLATFRC
ncbi:MAG: hypothetical protein H7138_26770 [Myxococcales bacterium]|nr:hypothetical protein [Myxococcales bacterium]